MRCSRLFLSAVLVLTPWCMATADVVELKTGERIEGTSAQASVQKVTIEVGGQALSFDRDKVRAIYIGGAPARGQDTSSAMEPLKALRAIQSVTSGGVNLREYSTRVNDTQVKVDSYLAEAGRGSPLAAPLKEAIDLYSLAAIAWSRLTMVGNSPVIILFRDEASRLDKCQPFGIYMGNLALPPGTNVNAARTLEERVLLLRRECTDVMSGMGPYRSMKTGSRRSGPAPPTGLTSRRSSL